VIDVCETIAGDEFSSISPLTGAQASRLHFLDSADFDGALDFRRR
jgi:hypothetical protein